MQALSLDLLSSTANYNVEPHTACKKKIKAKVVFMHATSDLATYTSVYCHRDTIKAPMLLSKLFN
jgi:hypothetical protein